MEHDEHETTEQTGAEDPQGRDRPNADTPPALPSDDDDTAAGDTDQLSDADA
jgi:hypothetical protein